MVIAAIALVLGVVVGFSTTAPLWLLISLFSIVIAAYLFSLSTLLPYLMVLIAGIMIATLNPTARDRNHPIAEHINQIASEKIDKLTLSPNSKSLIEAITLGRRNSMSRELISAYRHCGASHLLAISGLHIGMVALLLGAILRPIVLFPYGNIALSMVLVGLLWLYSAVVGFTPSVVRSTVMFTVLILNRLTTGRYDPLRSLAIAVVIMVTINPSIIYSISFQLSVSAALSIIIAAIPIMKWINSHCTGNRQMHILSYIIGLLVIGFVCTLATMPLILHYFGYVCWWGWLLSPILICISYLIISLSLIWLIAGFTFASPLFSWLLEILCSIQNGILLYCAQNL